MAAGVRGAGNGSGPHVRGHSGHLEREPAPGRVVYPGRVQVRSEDELFEQLAAGRLRGARELLVWDAALGDRAAAAIAEHPDAAGLVALDLSWNRIGPDGARALAASPHLAALRSLRLYHNDIGPEGAAAIANGRLRLTALNLCANGLGVEGAARLGEGPALRPTLERLHLGFVALGDEGARELSSAPWPRVEELNVRSNGIGPRGAAALLRGAFPALARLGLDDNPLDDGCVDALSQAPGLGRLAFLNVTSTDLGDQGAARLRAVAGCEIRW